MAENLPQDKAEWPTIEGLTHPAAEPLERIRIRTRESSITLSAWRLAIRSTEGEGAIVVVEDPNRQAIYRGDGVLLGWPQARLAEAYETLRPRPQDSEPEPMQLG
jgi:hypothetical protein